MSIETRSQGLIKWFSAAKGYGFIKRGSGSDVFVHAADLHASGIESGAVQPGMECSYEVEQTQKGDKAVSIKLGE
jgi:CspA family cold shock protein